MKKIAAIVLVTVMSFFLTAYSEGIDLKSMSDEELFALREAVEMECSTRSSASYNSWYDYGLGKYIPDFSQVVGREVDVVAAVSMDSIFSATISGATSEETSKYIEAVKAYGFTGNGYEVLDGFSGVKDGKYQVNVLFASNISYTTISVDIVS